MTSPYRCSVAAADQPMAGTAPVDAGFLLVEHPGPWGNKALAESRIIPAETRDRLAATAAEHGVRVLLIRRPGERSTGGPAYRVFLAHPASGRLDTQVLDDRAALADLDLHLPVRGAGWQPYAGPLLLVCTNGRRDVCCAEFGRPVAQAVAAAHQEETWETTHLGGHRFAVAALTLPDGMSYGRVGIEAGKAIVEAARRGHVVLEHLRGRTSYAPAEQAAEVALRQHLGLTAIGAVKLVDSLSDGETTTVTFRADGAFHDVEVRSEEQPSARQSCADLVVKPSTAWRVESVRARAGTG